MRDLIEQKYVYITFASLVFVKAWQKEQYCWTEREGCYCKGIGP